jgi:hypothetical protein
MATAFDKVTEMLPNRESIRGSTGGVIDKYKLKQQGDVGFQSNMGGLEGLLSNINLDPSSLQALKAKGMATGPSAWASLQKQQQGLEEANAMDAAGRQSNTALATGMSALASHGGATRASRERLATKTSRDLLMNRQAAGRQGISDRLGIDIADEGQKTDILKMLPGAEVQALQPALQKAGLWSTMANTDSARQLQTDLANRDYTTNVNQFNLTNLMKDMQGKNDYNMEAYKQKIAAYGSDRTADAQANSGGISWICTEVDFQSELSSEQWASLKKLKRYAIQHATDRAAFYLNGAGGLLRDMKQTGFDFASLRPFVLEIVRLVDAGEMDAAVEAYWTKVMELSVGQ